MTKTLVLAFVLVIGCKKYDKDWSDHKLVLTDDTIGAVKYQILIPEGLPKINSYLHGWDDAKPEGDHIPKVFTNIAILDPKSIDDAMGFDAAKAHFVRKDTRPDGYALTDVAPDKHEVSVKTYKKIGEHYLECEASQQTDGDELPSFEATKAMLEKICDSITFK
jgi:hypothetical protein